MERDGRRGKLTAYLGSCAVCWQHPVESVGAEIVLGSVAADAFISTPERSRDSGQDVRDISGPGRNAIGKR